MYKADPLITSLTTNAGKLTLACKLIVERAALRLFPIMGKLMHLFMVKQDDLNAFAHLHPVPAGRKRIFECAVPPLPAGHYSLYADITHENGFTQTLTSDLESPRNSTHPWPLQNSLGFQMTPGLTRQPASSQSEYLRCQETQYAYGRSRQRWTVAVKQSFYSEALRFKWQARTTGALPRHARTRCVT